MEEDAMSDIKFDLMEVRLHGPLDRNGALRKIEEMGRLCTGTPASPTVGGAARFVRSLVEKGHESVLEHVSATFVFTCTRACSHQIVRHRLTSVSQESQRSVRYDELPLEDDYEDADEAIQAKMFLPCAALSSRAYDAFEKAYRAAAEAYVIAMEDGALPEVARYVLPNAMKTRLAVTANLRQWKTMIGQRTSPKADAEIRELFTRVSAVLQDALPEIFE
jgi:thymidylate synthase (FAD)